MSRRYKSVLASVLCLTFLLVQIKPIHSGQPLAELDPLAVGPCGYDPQISIIPL